jgi:AraC-like DNA-binding protein
MYNDSFRKRYKTAPVAITENTEHFDTAPHIHREIEMLYIKEGSAEIIISDRRYTATQGDVIFVNPLDVHSIKADRSCFYHQRCICFDTSLIMDKSLCEELLSGDITISEYHHSDADGTLEISKLFDSLFFAVSDNSEELFLESVAYISMIFVNLRKAGLLLSKKSKSKKNNFVRIVQDYLSLHYNEQITSQDIAKELFYNQSYFCRLFRENYGISFLDYLTLYRISNAKLLLSSEKVRISDVAEQVGFLDASYFSRCFKKIVGISPVEYQKSQCS